MKIKIQTTLHCSTTAEIDIPSWDSIKEWFVKWDKFVYTQDGKTWITKDLNSCTDDIISWKYPLAAKAINPGTNKILSEYEN